MTPKRSRLEAHHSATLKEQPPLAGHPKHKGCSLWSIGGEMELYPGLANGDISVETFISLTLYYLGCPVAPFSGINGHLRDEIFINFLNQVTNATNTILSNWDLQAYNYIECHGFDTDYILQTDDNIIVIASPLGSMTSLNIQFLQKKTLSPTCLDYCHQQKLGLRKLLRTLGHS